MNPSGTCHQPVAQQRTNSQKCRVGKERRGPGDEAKERKTREEEERGKKDEKGGTYQSAGHWGLVVLRKMLLQGQDDAIGNDGGQDHVLKRRGKGGVKKQNHQREDSLQEGCVHPHTNFINPHRVCAVSIIDRSRQAGRTVAGPLHMELEPFLIRL